MKRLVVPLILFLILSSCCGGSFPCFCGCNGSKHLSLLSEPINQETLASTHVNTPDPLHKVNPLGERIRLSWKLPKMYQGKTLQGILKVHFNKPGSVELPFEITTLKGTYVYQLLNDEYFEKEGILAYRAELFFEGEQIDSFSHKMWAEHISFDNP